MTYLQNLHTHCTYCDGKDTPEQMVAYALEKGFDSLGFSSHSYTPYSPSAALRKDKIPAYRKEIPALKKKYKDRLKIFLGLEYDMYCGEDQTGYDYLIGSVHYLKVGSVYRGFDLGPAAVKALIDELYGGDGLSFVKDYYETVAKLPEYGNFDIIGHFDIITKNLEAIPFFDDTCPEYMGYALGAMEALRGKIDLFEVNSGAIARGYRSIPYPAKPLLKAFHDMGFKAVITSDCHDGRFLDCQFAESAELLKECGFQEKFVLTEEGFVPTQL